MRPSSGSSGPHWSERFTATSRPLSGGLNASVTIAGLAGAPWTWLDCPPERSATWMPWASDTLGPRRAPKDASRSQGDKNMSCIKHQHNHPFGQQRIEPSPGWAASEMRGGRRRQEPVRAALLVTGFHASHRPGAEPLPGVCALGRGRVAAQRKARLRPGDGASWLHPVSRAWRRSGLQAGAR